MPLADAVRALVAERTGRRPDGPIRLLTHLRYFGYCFNPVSVLLLLRPRPGATLEAIVAEVTNTPWNERHAYVLGAARNLGGRGQARATASTRPSTSRRSWRWTHEYDWRFTPPGERLVVHMENHHAGGPLLRRHDDPAAARDLHRRAGADAGAATR